MKQPLIYEYLFLIHLHPDFLYFVFFHSGVKKNLVRNNTAKAFAPLSPLPPKAKPMTSICNVTSYKSLIFMKIKG
jgi:hypothetical protein